MAIKLIALTFGYVESASTAKLIFCASKPAKTKKAAISSLAEYLYQKYLIDNDISDAEYGDCCNQYLGKHNFCADCGASLTPHKFNWNDFHMYLEDLNHTDCNTYGADCDFPNPNGWNPWDISFVQKQSSYIDIKEKAAQILCIALSKVRPELGSYNDDLYILADYRELIGE